MNKKYTVVSFSYDLPSDLNLNGEFKSVLQGLDWIFEISKKNLPQTTCLKIYDTDTSVDDALKLAANEIKSVVKKIREQGFSNFNVERYFFLGHRTDSANALFGEDLV